MSFEPLTREDLEDGKLVAGQLRALQREVRSGFELVTTKLLTAIERLNQRFDAQEDRLTDLERRVLVLETKPKRRASAARRK